jgi:flagellar protein FlaG
MKEGGAMSMQINNIGNAAAFLPWNGVSQKAWMRTTEQKLATSKALIAFLPGSQGNGDYSATGSIDLNVIAEDLERISSTLNKKLVFSVDHESHEILIKVIDPQTDRVVKILPPEELRRLHHKIKEAIGVLFNELI